MKKIVLIIFFLFLIMSTPDNSYAQCSSQEEVEMRQPDPTNPGPRSLVQVPEVWIDRDFFQLSVQFSKPLAHFTITVFNQYGMIVCYNRLITDGEIHLYNLILAIPGTYTIIILSRSEFFIGEFEY